MCHPSSGKRGFSYYSRNQTDPSAASVSPLTLDKEGLAFTSNISEPKIKVSKSETPDCAGPAKTHRNTVDTQEGVRKDRSDHLEPHGSGSAQNSWRKPKKDKAYRGNADGTGVYEKSEEKAACKLSTGVLRETGKVCADTPVTALPNHIIFPDSDSENSN